MDFTFLGGPALHPYHRVTAFIRFYESGLFIKLAILVAIFLWILIGLKLYRAQKSLSRSIGMAIEEYYRQQIKELYFVAVVIFASLVGFMLGSTLG